MRTCLLRKALAIVTAFVGVSAASITMAAPTPLESGWTARKVASGVGAGLNNLAYDPLSTDLFVTEFSGHCVWRVTQAGVKTAIAADPGFVFQDLAFDPLTRRIFTGGYGQTTLRVLDVSGAVLANLAVPEPYNGIAAVEGVASLEEIGNLSLKGLSQPLVIYNVKE